MQFKTLVIVVACAVIDCLNDSHIIPKHLDLGCGQVGAKYAWIFKGCAPKIVLFVHKNSNRSLKASARIQNCFNFFESAEIF